MMGSPSQESDARIQSRKLRFRNSKSKTGILSPASGFHEQESIARKPGISNQESKATFPKPEVQAKPGVRARGSIKSGGQPRNLKTGMS